LTRLLFTVLVAVIAIAVLTAAIPPERKSTAVFVVKTRVVVSHYQGLSARVWAGRAWRARVAYRRERRVLLSKPTVVEAINLACATYGNCALLWRRAKCETGDTFSPTAHNPSGASGLFQFLPSTWTSTPYARLSIWSPYANALAAGWMQQQGRGGEWVCQ
jgi:hypothetical protein